MGTDEVQHRAEALVLGAAQSAAELLQKQRRAFGRPQHQQCVNRGDIDTLVEQVHREHDADPVGGEVFKCCFPVIP